MLPGTVLSIILQLCVLLLCSTWILSTIHNSIGLFSIRSQRTCGKKLAAYLYNWYFLSWRSTSAKNWLSLLKFVIAILLLSSSYFFPNYLISNKPPSRKEEEKMIGAMVMMQMKSLRGGGGIETRVHSLSLSFSLSVSLSHTHPRTHQS